MASYPLLFGFRDIVAGKHFFAGVIADGRGLLTEEPDGQWMYGVNPGGVAGGGAERAEAFRDFKVGYLSVLFDIAAEASTFSEFRERVTRFFEQTNADVETEWLAAVTAVRAGQLSKDQGLPVKTADAQPLRLEVVELVHGDPGVNAFDAWAEAA